MARAIIVQQYADGTATKMVMQSDLNHADVYDELVARVLRMYRETCVEPDEAE
jgi:hypothetical protein